MARPAGRPNKNRDHLVKLIKKDYPEYNCILEMVSIAMQKDQTGEYLNDVNIRLNANKEIAQYIYPKLKAIEIIASEDAVKLPQFVVNVLKPEKPKKVKSGN